MTSILGPATVECNTAAFLGTVFNGAEWADVHPTYTGCQALGSAATVKTESASHKQCNYRFDGFTVSEMGDVDVNCDLNANIEIDVPGICKLIIGPQSFLNGVSYTNIEGPPMRIGVKATVKGISFTKTAPSSGGNNCSLITGTTAEYNSTDTVEGVGTGITVTP